LAECAFSTARGAHLQHVLDYVTVTTFWRWALKALRDLIC